jgi:hypothetical protein
LNAAALPVAWAEEPSRVRCCESSSRVLQMFHLEPCLQLSAAGENKVRDCYTVWKVKLYLKDTRVEKECWGNLGGIQTQLNYWYTRNVTQKTQNTDIRQMPNF